MGSKVTFDYSKACGFVQDHEMQYMSELAEQAKEKLRVSEDQYEVGMENLTNLLEAQAQWQQAWSEWVDAKATLKLCESEYLKAIGKLE